MHARPSVRAMYANKSLPYRMIPYSTYILYYNSYYVTLSHLKSMEITSIHKAYIRTSFQ